jgi:hypothetical protein
MFLLPSSNNKVVEVEWKSLEGERKRRYLSYRLVLSSSHIVGLRNRFRCCFYLSRVAIPTLKCLKQKAACALERDGRSATREHSSKQEWEKGRRRRGGHNISMTEAASETPRD